MNGKVLTLLGFASKAGALSYGAGSATESINRKKAKGVLYAFDISPKSQKEIEFHCKKANVPAYKLSDIGMESLSKAVGRKCGVVAILSDNFLTPLTPYLISDI